MSKSFQLLSQAVAEFHDWVELPKHKHLSPKLMLEIDDERRWDSPYLVDPNLVGCYVFEHENGEISYVGSVSANSSFGYRFANGYLSKDPDAPSKAKYYGQAENARRIYVVDMPRHLAFVAPALEQFLITYLCPTGNKKDAVTELQSKLDPTRLDADSRVSPKSDS